MMLAIPPQLLDAAKPGGVLSSLQVTPASDLEALTNDFPGLPSEYLAFVQTIGIGETKNEIYIYLPIPGSQFAEHPSFKIYNGAPYKRLFGVREPAPSFLLEQVFIVADTGASWKYGLSLSASEEIKCLDLFGPSLEPEASGFFAFIEQQITE